MGKVAVLGIGQSISEFDIHKSEFDITIGVNDIWRVVKTDVVVVLNYPREFYPQRIKTIENSKPKAFYSQIVNWDSLVPNFKLIKLLPGYPNVYCGLEFEGYHKSYFSPFVAIQIAYREYNADEVHLFGVDMTNHKHLRGKLLQDSIKHFKNLRKVLSEKGCNIVVHGKGVLTQRL